VNPQPHASADAGVTSKDLARAARLLAVRSRREATGLFAGNYASAFRGGGLEFEESRPYAPGDDVRTIDWVATSRTGETTVKCFREERNQTLLFALDTSASMQFGSAGPSKGAAAAHALALLAAAAGRAGDRTALLAFDDGAHEIVPIGRGRTHSWRLIRAAVEAARRAEGGTRIAGVARALASRPRRRSTAVLFSDFRDPSLLTATGTSRLALSGLSRHADVVTCVIFDPLEEAIPDVGPLRITDPERPQATFVLDTGRRRNRERYRAAWIAHRRRLDRALRRCGAETVWLRCDQSPLHTLGRFFRERAGRRSRGVA
jgi:uncharacterized protein (DUF58 family)